MADYSVGEVARFAGVSVRSLHHYDEIGLLTPCRDDAGHRRYTEADLARLQRILAYRELELPLDAIADLLAGDGDEIGHLRRQHARLQERIARLQHVLTTLETTMEARRAGVELTPDEMLEVFGDHDPGEHAEEAEERWGDTDAWRESRRRTSRYTKADWKEAMAEADQVVAGFAAAMADGAPPGGERAMDLAETHRRHISRWFYPCGYDIHRGLGEMYVTDPRFAVTYESVAEGLAGYLRAAIAANAARAETP